MLERASIFRALSSSFIFSGRNEQIPSRSMLNPVLCWNEHQFFRASIEFEHQFSQRTRASIELLDARSNTSIVLKMGVLGTSKHEKYKYYLGWFYWKINCQGTNIGFMQIVLLEFMRCYDVNAIYLLFEKYLAQFF